MQQHLERDHAAKVYKESTSWEDRSAYKSRNYAQFANGFEDEPVGFFENLLSEDHPRVNDLQTCPIMKKFSSIKYIIC